MYSSSTLSWIWYLHHECAVWLWTSLPTSPGPIFPILKLESSWTGWSPRTFPTLKSCDSFLIPECTIYVPGFFPRDHQLSRGRESTGATRASVILGMALLSPESPFQLSCSMCTCLLPRLPFSRDTPELPATPPHGRFRGRPPSWPCRRAIISPHSSLTLLLWLMVGGGVRRRWRGLVSRWKRHGTFFWGPGKITGRGTKESNLAYSVYLIIRSLIQLCLPASDSLCTCLSLFLRRMERNVSEVFPNVCVCSASWVHEWMNACLLSFCPLCTCWVHFGWHPCSEL